MKKPVLVVMAAGMGSRYGGLKQIDPVDSQGHIIMDFSIYDAVKAGFEKVIFIIKKENEADFKAAIGDRLSKGICIPGFEQSSGRLCCPGRQSKTMGNRTRYFKLPWHCRRSFCSY